MSQPMDEKRLAEIEAYRSQAHLAPFWPCDAQFRAHVLELLAEVRRLRAALERIAAPGCELVCRDSEWPCDRCYARQALEVKAHG